MTITTTRRSLLHASLAVPAAAMLPRPGGAAEPFKVGFVYVAPIGDAGWTYQHELGRRALVAALGDEVKTTYIENVPEEGADAERVIRKMATDGHKLIYTTSFGFMEPTLKVAKMFPKVKFAHCTGYKRAPNVATYSARFYEGRYLTGIIAGRMTKSKVIGYVAAFPIPEVVQGINAVTLAARSVNPDVVTKVVFVSSWFDPGKERAAADTLISQGADVIMHHTDSTAIVQAGEEKGVWSFGYDSDMSKFGPKSELTAVTMVWDQYYIDKTKAAIAGTWKSDDVWGGLKAGMVKLAPLNAAIPDAVKAEVADVQGKIESGATKPFTGPVKDQAGAEKIAAGKSLSDGDILGMSWFVEGVQGKLG
jgi:simple sugar transport system substrate-binding protein